MLAHFDVRAAATLCLKLREKRTQRGRRVSVAIDPNGRLSLLAKMPLIASRSAAKGRTTPSDGTIRQINPTDASITLWMTWCRLRRRGEDLHERSNRHIPVGYVRVPGVKRAYSNPRVMLRSRNRSLAAPAQLEQPFLSVAALAHSSRESVCSGRRPNCEVRTRRNYLPTRGIARQVRAQLRQLGRAARPRGVPI